VTFRVMVKETVCENVAGQIWIVSVLLTVNKHESVLSMHTGCCEMCLQEVLWVNSLN